MLAAAQVVDAIAKRLRTLDDSGDRVFTSRSWALNEKQVPAWLVTAEDESIERLTMHAGGLQQHTLTVKCSGVAKATEDLDDVLNNVLAVGALKALFGTPEDAKLLPLRNAQMYQTGASRSFTAGAEGSLGQIDLLLEVTFRTLASDPETLQ